MFVSVLFFDGRDDPGSVQQHTGNKIDSGEKRDPGKLPGFFEHVGSEQAMPRVLDDVALDLS